MTVFGTRRWLYHFMHNDKVSSRGLAHFNLRRAQRYLNCQPDNNEHFIKTKSSDISSPVNAMKVDTPPPPNQPNTHPTKKQPQKPKQKEKQHTKKVKIKGCGRKCLSHFLFVLGLFCLEVLGIQTAVFLRLCNILCNFSHAW